MSVLRRSTFLLGVAGLCLGWELLANQFDTFRLLVASPSLVFAYLVANYQSLALDTLVTSAEAVCGLLLAAVVAFVVIVVCMASDFAVRIVQPVVVTIQVVPLIVFAPFVSLLFGIEIGAKIVLAAVVGIFSLVSIVLDGYRRLPSFVTELVIIYRIRRTDAIRSIFLPYLLPEFFTGLRVGSTLCVLGAVVAEFSGARYGLGRNILLTSIRIEPELMMISVGLCALVGFAFYGTIVTLERAVVRWK